MNDKLKLCTDGKSKILSDGALFNFSNPVGVHQLIYIAVLSLIAVNSKKYVTRKKYIGYYISTYNSLLNLPRILDITK